MREGGSRGTVDEWHDLSDYERGAWRRCAAAVQRLVPVALRPTREERLMRYRCATLQGLLAPGAAGGKGTVQCAENTAHAMLAAERPAEAPVGNDPSYAALAELVRRSEIEARAIDGGLAFERGRGQGMRDVYFEIKRILGMGKLS